MLDPGKQWHYSNLAYALLGEVIERASGIPATEFIVEQILRPLGLDRTTWRPGERCDRLLRRALRRRCRLRAVPEKNAIAPAGALFSTVVTSPGGARS